MQGLEEFYYWAEDGCDGWSYEACEHGCDGFVVEEIGEVDKEWDIDGSYNYESSIWPSQFKTLAEAVGFACSWVPKHGGRMVVMGIMDCVFTAWDSKFLGR